MSRLAGLPCATLSMPARAERCSIVIWTRRRNCPRRSRRISRPRLRRLRKVGRNLLPRCSLMTGSALDVLGRPLRRLRRRFDPKGHIDAVAGARVSGWAFSSRRPVHIDASIGGYLVASTILIIERPDVAFAFPRESGALEAASGSRCPMRRCGATVASWTLS